MKVERVDMGRESRRDFPRDRCIANNWTAQSLQPSRKQQVVKTI